MKISEIKGEKAIEVLAEIVEPVTTILNDEEVRGAEERTKAVTIALMKYPKEVIKIMALLEGEDPETYEPSLLSLPKKMIEILEDEEVQGLFTSAVTNEE